MRFVQKLTAGAVVAVLALAAAGCGGDEDGGKTADGLTKVKVVLPWLIQGESAGHFVAAEKGYYKDAGLDVEILPGGPDVSHAKLLASGAVDFAITGGPVVLTGRAQGMPLVSVFTGNQEDGLMFLCKKSTGIESWEDLAGRSVGVWVGISDPAFYYGVELAGLERDDVKVVPQKFSMTEFLEDKMDCASAMAWNELHVVLDAGYSLDELTVLKVSDFGKFMPGDGMVTTEKMIEEDPEIVQAFADATMRGWQDALADPEGAADATLEFAPDLDHAAQVIQVQEVAKLMATGAAAEEGAMGAQGMESWVAVQDALLGAGMLKEEQDLSKAFTDDFWTQIPAEHSAIPAGLS
jgi:NitT/TauT family transport system substrate-binding protein